MLRIGKATPAIPALRRLRQGYYLFEDSVGCIVR
jgi:hypothetical protein